MLLKYIFDLSKVNNLETNRYRNIYCFLDLVINSKSTPITLMDINPNNIENYLNLEKGISIPGGELVKDNSEDIKILTVIRNIYHSLLTIISNNRPLLYNAVITSPHIRVLSVNPYNNYQYLLFKLDVPGCKEIPKLTLKK